MSPLAPGRSRCLRHADNRAHDADPGDFVPASAGKIGENVPLDRADRLLFRDRLPDQPVHLLHGLDLRLEYTIHPFTIAPVAVRALKTSYL